MDTNTVAQKEGEGNIYLINAEQQHSKNPEFRIPDREYRTNLATGDIVKLIFYSKEPRGAERMWVVVNRAENGRYTGWLDSQPVSIPLKRDDSVEFGPEHVIEIAKFSDMTN